MPKKEKHSKKPQTQSKNLETKETQKAKERLYDNYQRNQQPIYPHLQLRHNLLLNCKLKCEPINLNYKLKCLQN